MLIYDCIEYLADTSGMIRIKGDRITVADSSEVIEDYFDNNVNLVISRLTGRTAVRSHEFIDKEIEIMFFKEKVNGRYANGNKWFTINRSGITCYDYLVFRKAVIDANIRTT